MRWMVSVLLAGAIFVSGAAQTQQIAAPATPRESLLVLSKRDHTLAIVDPVTLKVVAKAPVGEDPHEVTASADGKTAYVSIYGAGAYHILSVIDLVGQRALPDIDLGPLNGPHGLTTVGGKIWFTAEGAKAIGSYDPASAKIDWVMGTGQDRTHMIYVTADQKRIYTTNVASATVSILEKAMQVNGPMGMPPPPPGGPGSGTSGSPPQRAPGPPGGGASRPNWEQTVIPVGRGVEGFDVSPNGTELWAANAQDGTISIVSLLEKKVLTTLEAKVPSANRLKFSPDGRLVLVTGFHDGDVVIIAAKTRKEIKRLNVGHACAGIQMQPDSSKAYIACSPDNYVAVVSLRTLQVLGHIEAGGEPDGLAWAVQR